MIRAVIFDYDGVIVDSARIIYEINQAVIEKLRGKRFRDFEDFKEKFGHYEDYYKSMDPSDPTILARSEKIFFEEMQKRSEKPELFEDVVSVIKELSKKFKVGIVSHNYKESIEASLKKGKISDSVSSIIDNRVDNIKPHPDHMLICLKELGVKPEESVMVGDSPIDVEAARRAGFAKIIAVLYGFYTKKYLGGADYFAETPKEILKIIEGIK